MNAATGFVLKFLFRRGATLEEALICIRRILDEGPVLQKELSLELKSAGFTNSTIIRALKSASDIVSHRVSICGRTRGIGAWVVCTVEQFGALKDAKFDHLEQLKHRIANWYLQDDQILDNYPEWIDESFCDGVISISDGL